LPAFHLPPIHAVVSCGPSGTLRCGRPDLGAGFPLRCFQRLSLPDLATLRCPGRDNRSTSGRSTSVLSYWEWLPSSLHAPTADTDRTVSRRSKPSSRTALTGEQPDPWDLLQPQDAMSRHRGAKPPRRCELSGVISLLSPGYLLSVERRPVHEGPPDH